MGREAADIAWVGTEHGMANFKRILARSRPVELTVRFLPPLSGEALASRKTIAAAAREAILRGFARTLTPHVERQLVFIELKTHQQLECRAGHSGLHFRLGQRIDRRIFVARPALAGDAGADFFRSVASARSIIAEP